MNHAPAGRRAPLIFTAGAFAVAIFVVGVSGAPWLNSDTMWALVWGEEIRGVGAPSIAQDDAPTPHLLLTVIATLVGFLGNAVGYWVMAAIAVLSFAIAVILTAMIAQRAFSMRAAVVAAVVLLVSPGLLELASAGTSDVLFLALFLGAVYLEITGRRPAVAMSYLVAAGLVRPESWLMIAAYWLWKVPASSSSDRLRITALAVSAPALWLGADLLITGDPLFSLTGTQEGARELNRTTGLTNVPGQSRSGLRRLIGREVLVGGFVGAAIAAIQPTRSRVVLLAIGSLGALTFALLGIFALSLLPRYLLLPAVMLAIMFACAATAWTEEKGVARLIAGVAALLIVAMVVVGAPARFRAIEELRERTEANRDQVASLRDFHASVDAQRFLDSCQAIYVRDRRPRGLVSYTLEVDVKRVQSAVRTAPRPDGLFLTATPVVVKRGLVAFFPRRAERIPAARPPSYRVVYTNGGWELSAGPACRA